MLVPGVNHVMPILRRAPDPSSGAFLLAVVHGHEGDWAPAHARALGEAHVRDGHERARRDLLGFLAIQPSLVAHGDPLQDAVLSARLPTHLAPRLVGPALPDARGRRDGGAGGAQVAALGAHPPEEQLAGAGAPLVVEDLFAQQVDRLQQQVATRRLRAHPADDTTVRLHHHSQTQPRPVLAVIGAELQRQDLAAHLHLAGHVGAELLALAQRGTALHRVACPNLP
mmetsp:Transcript_41234/g.106685  ORF Transcript_41234/g.106685 Transcript_41234/m.106685 type:complete len:226 (-) Transcript_41234:578-1255(-)